MKSSKNYKSEFNDLILKENILRNKLIRQIKRFKVIYPEVDSVDSPLLINKENLELILILEDYEKYQLSQEKYIQSQINFDNIK